MSWGDTGRVVPGGQHERESSNSAAQPDLVGLGPREADRPTGREGGREGSFVHPLLVLAADCHGTRVLRKSR